MDLTTLLTPTRRVLLVVLVAIALLTAPLWSSTLHLAESTYQYERVQVTTDGDRAIDDVDDDFHPYIHLSEEIGCSTYRDVRTCAFEAHLAENRTIPTAYTTDVQRDSARPPGIDRYQYVIVNDSVYEATYETARPVENSSGGYYADLTLEPADADEVLDSVSLDADADAVPSVVREAAETGEAESHREVDVPETPIRLEDGTYYRVYLAGWDHDTSTGASLADWLLTYGSPLAGLVVLWSLSRRVDIQVRIDD